MKNLLKAVLKPILWWPNLVKQVQKRDILNTIDLFDGCQMLDIGCGEGQFDYYAKNQSPAIEITACDIVERTSWKSFPTVTYKVLDAFNLPYPDRTFDRILLGEIISLVSQPEKMLQEANRVLKDDGKIVIVNGKGFQTIVRFYQSRWLFPIRMFFSKVLKLPSTYVAFMKFHIKNTDLDERSFEKMYSNIEENVNELVQTKTNLRIVEISYSFNQLNEFVLANFIILRYAFGLDRPRFNYVFLYPIAYFLERVPFFNKDGLSFIMTLEKKKK